MFYAGVYTTGFKFVVTQVLFFVVVKLLNANASVYIAS